MSYLLDTSVVSEVARPRPDPGVLAWFRGVPDSGFHLSVLTLGELSRGAGALTEGARKERLRIWLEDDIRAWFEGRILPVDERVADRWGRAVAMAEGAVPAVDSLLAATALQHGLRLVTRNVTDFRRFAGLEVITPWR